MTNKKYSDLASASALTGAEIVAVSQAGASKKVLLSAIKTFMAPLATVLTGLSTATNAVITASDTALVALGKLQAQITAKLPGTYRPALTIAHSAVAVSVTGTLVETTLATIVIPGGMMGANGRIRVSAVWSYTNSANAKTMKMNFGGSLANSNGATTTASLKTQYSICNRNATNSQLVEPSATSMFSSNTSTVTTLAKDTTADQSITLTGLLVNTGETITLESYLVELINP